MWVVTLAGLLVFHPFLGFLSLWAILGVVPLIFTMEDTIGFFRFLTLVPTFVQVRLPVGTKLLRLVRRRYLLVLLMLCIDIEYLIALFFIVPTLAP